MALGVTVTWSLEGPAACVGSAARWPDRVRRDEKLRCSSEATTSWPVANSSSMLAAPLPPRRDSMGHQAPRITTSALSSSPSAGPTGNGSPIHSSIVAYLTTPIDPSYLSSSAEPHSLVALSLWRSSGTPRSGSDLILHTPLIRSSSNKARDPPLSTLDGWLFSILGLACPHVVYPVCTLLQAHGLRRKQEPMF